MNLLASEIISPLEELFLPILKEKKVRLFLKRDDLIHPEISGNKWRKLKYNIKYFQENNYKGILSFGGAYSNHIAALAFTCYLYKIPCIGIIRGEEVSNHTLANAKKLGMQLIFVSREEYRKRNNLDYLTNLKSKFSEYFIIPEGGTNQMAISGTKEIVNEFAFRPDFIASPIGTGGTIAGIIESSFSKILGFPALKGDFVKTDIEKLLSSNKENWEIITGYEFGGYAKVNNELFEFVNDFITQTSIQLDYIYNGKMMYGIIELIKQDYFPAESTIVAIHTGGIQGNIGIENKIKNIH
jgi:1-aminocyclopropane-1-carboxylate deaminase